MPTSVVTCDSYGASAKTCKAWTLFVSVFFHWHVVQTRVALSITKGRGAKRVSRKFGWFNTQISKSSTYFLVVRSCCGVARSENTSMTRNLDDESCRQWILGRALQTIDVWFVFICSWFCSWLEAYSVYTRSVLWWTDIKWKRVCGFLLQLLATTSVDECSWNCKPLLMLLWGGCNLSLPESGACCSEGIVGFCQGLASGI